MNLSDHTMKYFIFPLPRRWKSSLFFLFLLFTLFSTSPVSSFADCTRQEKGKGIFVVVQANQFFDKTKDWKWLGAKKTNTIFEVLMRPYISGFTYYVPWAALEPSEGRYRWDIIDRIVARAEVEKKPVNIGILWGSKWGTPKWLWKNPAVEKTTIIKKKMGIDREFAEETIFPFDPISRKKYLHLIKALATHQRKNTNFAFRDDPSINYIAVTGPSSSTGLEMVLHTGKEKKDIQIIKEKILESTGADNFIDGYAQEWIHAIEEFAEIFPAKHLGLALHLGLNKNRTVQPAKLVYKYLRRKSLQKKVRLMTLTLTGKGWWHYTPPLESEAQKLLFLLKKAQNDGFSTGLQLIGIAGASKDKEKRARPFEIALTKGVHFGADWIEIFVEDLIYDRRYLNRRKAFLADTHPFYDFFIQEIKNTHFALIKQKKNSCH